MQDAIRSEAKEAQFAFAPADDRRAPTRGGDEALWPWTRVPKPTVARVKEAIHGAQPSGDCNAAVDQSSQANSGKAKEAAIGSQYPDLRAQAGEGSRFHGSSMKPAMGRGCSEIAPKPLP